MGGGQFNMSLVNLANRNMKYRHPEITVADHADAKNDSSDLRFVFEMSSVVRQYNKRVLRTVISYLCLPNFKKSEVHQGVRIIPKMFFFA